MTLHLGGDPQRLYWGGDATAAYLGDQLVWSAETLAHSITVPSTVVEYFNWPGMDLHTEPAGPGSVYRVVPDITYTPVANLVLKIERRRWEPNPFNPDGGAWLTEDLLDITSGASEALVTLHPGDSLRLEGSINGPGSSTITGSVELYRREDAEPHAPLFPASGSGQGTIGHDGVVRTTRAPFYYIQDAGDYRVTVDFPDGHDYIAVASTGPDVYRIGFEEYPPHPAGRRVESRIIPRDTGSQLAPGVSKWSGPLPNPPHTFTFSWSIEKL